jgi:hypothetical protein
MARKDVSKQEFLQMASRCRNEIKDLRARIAYLEPKAEAYDSLTAVLRLLPQPSRGMSEDLVWRLDKRISELMEPAEEDQVKEREE